MISFDIQKKPPTEQDITKERIALQKKIKRLRIVDPLTDLIGFLAIGTFIWYGSHFVQTFLQSAEVVETYTSWIFLVKAAGALIILLIMLMMPFLILRYGGEVKRRIEALQQEGSFLDPIKREDCPDMLAISQQHEEIRYYQNAVAATGRQLTQAEFDVAKEWTYKKTAKESSNKQ